MFEISAHEKTRYANRKSVANVITLLGTAIGAAFSLMAMTKLSQASTAVTSVYDMAMMLASPVTVSALQPISHNGLLVLMTAGLLAMSAGGLAFANTLAKDYGSRPRNRNRG